MYLTLADQYPSDHLFPLPIYMYSCVLVRSNSSLSCFLFPCSHSLPSLITITSTHQHPSLSLTPMHETTELHTSFPSPPSYQHKPNIIFSPSSSPSPHSMMPVTTTTEDNQSSGSRKTSGSSPRPPEKSPNCPRCDSPNTKFCYYNNYSLSQPRHFCKTCRRYWTKGGALRNVPIGGGCRKTNKKAKSSSSRDSSSSSEISSAFRFLHGLSAPPIDFQFGRLSSPNSQFLSLGDLSTANPSSSSLMGLNSYNNNWGIQESGSGASSMNVNTSLASSIECLSSINQDLHWKLQQQRLAMVMGGGGGGGGGGESNQNQIQKESCTTTSASSAVVLPSGFLENQMINQQQQQQHPLSFQNLEISKPVATSAVVTPTTTTGEWFFQNPYTTNQHMSNGNDTTTISNWNGGVHHHQGWSSYSDLPQ